MCYIFNPKHEEGSSSILILFDVKRDWKNLPLQPGTEDLCPPFPRITWNQCLHVYLKGILVRLNESKKTSNFIWIDWTNHNSNQLMQLALITMFTLYQRFLFTLRRVFTTIIIFNLISYLLKLFLKSVWNYFYWINTDLIKLYVNWIKKVLNIFSCLEVQFL